MECGKWRNEIKYIVSEVQLALIEQRIAAVCPMDSNTKDGVGYNIRSVYFDDYNNSCYYDNENGSDPREKFRIRIYNGSSKEIFLERKIKKNQKTLKQSVKIDESDVYKMFEGNFMESGRDVLLDEFIMQNATRILRPKVIVDYDRKAFVYDIGNVRITFDRNISSGRAFDRFFDANIEKRPVMQTGMHILEVKYDELLPNYIYNCLSIGNLRQTAFSKYYMCRKFYCV